MAELGLMIAGSTSASSVTKAAWVYRSNGVGVYQKSTGRGLPTQ
jgi:hypothetical protein